MKGLFAIAITAGLWAGCYLVSGVIYFDVMWIMVGLTSLWAGIDSKKIELSRYKLGKDCKPVAVFCLCYLLWIGAFPLYLWARFRIQAGEASLKAEPVENAGRIKRFFRRFSRKADQIARGILLVMVALKMVFLAFCIEESWRGPRVWENYKHELEARGESFDWDALKPPPVPASQNFFRAPMMTAWFVKPSGNIAITEDLSQRMNYSNVAAQVVIAEVTVCPPSNSPGSDVFLRLDDFKAHQQARELVENIAGPGTLGAQNNFILTSQSFDLKQLKPLHLTVESSKKPDVKELYAFFSLNGTTPNPLLFRPIDGNRWQVLAAFYSAADYLKWSDQFRGDFDQMREAVKRPYAQMDGDYSHPVTIPIPNYVNFRAIIQTLGQRAQCYLLLNQPDKALQELTLMNDLRHVLEGAPTGQPMTMVSAMVNVAVTGVYADAIADGFRLHAWQEPQLVALEKQLGQINVAPSLKEALHNEQISAWRIMQTTMVQLENRQVPDVPFWQSINKMTPLNLTRGFCYFSVFNAVRLEQIAVESMDLSEGVVSPQKLGVFKQEDAAMYQKKFPFDVYYLFADIAVPAFTKAVQTLAFNQTKANEAQIVCALERYHLLHNNYPETLNELVPQFMDKLPHDIIGGQPLKYRRTSDGQFALYSIGWNETDDGGQYAYPTLEKGDWCWQ